MERTTAFKVANYSIVDSTFFDSVAHSKLFRTDNVHDFGIVTSQLFATVNNLGLTNKRWQYLTYAQGNYEELAPGQNEYSWENAGDADTDLRIVKKYVTDGQQVGKMHTSWLIGVNHPWYGEPALLKCEDDNAPLLKIVGQPYSEGAFYVIEVKLQDGADDSWIDDSFFNEGRTLVQGGSGVSNEQNRKYRNIGPWSDNMRLRSQVGQVAAEIEFSDRFLKLEMAAAMKGKGMSGKYNFRDNAYSDAFSRGKLYYAKVNQPGKKGKVEKGFFLGVAEERLLEAVEHDLNFMCEFGRTETDIDQDTKRTIRYSAGWRQIVKDGQYFTHSGYFTLKWLIDKLHAVLHKKRRFKNRKPYLVGGTGAITFISQLISDSVLISNTAEPGFAIRKNDTPTGLHNVEYSYGFMFTRFEGPNGVTIQVMYDPSKDDTDIYKVKAPGSFLPLESFNIDILDFGETEDAMENTKGTNITMVKEGMADYYFSVSNAMKRTGPVTDGSNTWTFGKDLRIYREASGGLCVWDPFVVGRIEWVLN